ncbi:MAG: response regulator [Defluviitaleaceae bacterium]|nr:response regulator [Defluviitaleaceae bacterium]
MKKLRNINVVTRLLLSFAVVILMFFTVAIYSYITAGNMDFLHRYRIHNMETRNVLLLELHQELTEFRRLLKASYYNPHWIETTEDNVRIIYESYITLSYLRMIEHAHEYIDSISRDDLLPIYLDYYNSEDLIIMMETIIAFVAEVFRRFDENFFIGGNDSHYKGDILDYTHLVEDTIRRLRDINRRVDATIQNEVEIALTNNRRVIVVALSFTFVFSVALVFLTVKAFAVWVKKIEDAAVRSLQESTIAEENSRAKSRFLARMSHEIRTPISAVLGISEIQLQKDDLPKEVEDAFNRIYTSSSVLVGILNDILDLSKIEAGKLRVIMAKYDVSSFIQDVLQMHVVSLETKKFKFNVLIDGTLPAELIGDVLRLKQVLNNVLSNAFKYTDTGMVEFTVKRASHTEKDMINMVVTIRDTGRGMTGEQVKLLLEEEYTRFHEEENRKVHGTGLGMPIVMNLIELMNAQISIDSYVKIGTLVTLQIPQKIASTKEVGVRTAQSLSKLQVISKKPIIKPVNLSHGKVLVVDDVDTNLFVARGLLGLYKLKVETCDNANDAIEKIKQGNTYDIIFMDYMMPDLNGMDATKILRDSGYDKPIIALTANAFVGQAKEFLNNGFDDFIAKPIQTRYMHHIILKYVEQIADTPEDSDDDDFDFDIEMPNPEDISEYYSNPEILQMARQEFAETQASAVSEINAALAKNDHETARRIAHTVKGMAHMMGEDALSFSAEALESAIFKGEIPTDELFSNFQSDIEQVLAKI